MKLVQTPKYIAFDGQVFETETTCLEYEARQMKYLEQLISDKKVILLDANVTLLPVEAFLKNPSKLYGIGIREYEAAAFIHKLLTYYKLPSPWNEGEPFTTGYFWYSEEYGDYLNITKQFRFYEELLNNFNIAFFSKQN